MPDRPKQVTLHQVTYRYPEADQDTLHEVDFEVRQGAIVAVVGENCSGKTTLMKLLSGLNLPTDGVVTWDGVSTRDLDPHALWKRCAVVPHEFARWPMAARVMTSAFSPLADGVIQSTSGTRPDRVCMVVSRQSRRRRWRETTHQKWARARSRPVLVAAGTETALLSRTNGTQWPPRAAPSRARTSSPSPPSAMSSLRTRQIRVSGPPPPAPGRSSTAG